MGKQSKGYAVKKVVCRNGEVRWQSNDIGKACLFSDQSIVDRLISWSACQFEIKKFVSRMNKIF